MHVPQRFQDRVLEHANAASILPRHPLMLVIQGRPGTGKSAQVEFVLRQHGFWPVVRSAAGLTGRFEGQPMEELEELLSTCQQISESKRDSIENVAVVLEDFDLSAASIKDGVSRTSNAQLLNGALMHFVDGAPSMRMDGGRRVPVFLTGNDMTNLYEALERPGRMEFFDWEPTGDELASMVRELLKDTGLRVSGDAEVASLVAKFDALTIAEVASSISRMQARWLFEQAAKLKRIRLAELEAMIGQISLELSDLIVQIEALRTATARGKNFLEE